MATTHVPDSHLTNDKVEKQSKSSLEHGTDTPPQAEGRHEIEKGIKTDPDAVVEDNGAAARRASIGLNNKRWYLTLLGLMLGALLYGLDTTIAADVQGSVYESLGDIENLPWVGLGFPMASVAVILLIGRLYGLFSPKSLIIGSIFLFEVGSAVCGAAPTSNALIVGRVIAGMGGAGMYLGALTYISIFATNKEQALLNALTGLSWGTGAILGPVIGGALSDSKATWRWAFYINLPLAGLFAPVYFFIFPHFNPRPDKTVGRKFAEIDWVGAFLNGAVFVLFMIVVTFSGSTYRWSSGSDIALWVVFGVTLIAYMVQQGFALFTTRENQIFPIHYLKSRTMVCLYVATSAAAAANAVPLYFIPLFFQFTKGDSALDAAVRLLPFMIFFIFFVMVAGGTLPVVGRYQIYYIAGAVLTIIGGALMYTIDTTTSNAKIYGYEILVASGTGVMFQNAYAVASALRKDKANAIGFINVSQIGTIAIALAIAGCLFQNLGFQALKKDFAAYNFSDDYIRSALAGSISPIFTSNDKAVIEIAVKAVSKTIVRIMGMIWSAGAVMFVAACLMKPEKINVEMTAGG